MKNRDKIILAILFIVFAAALIKLFALRFEWGDVYPQYSSLRADPLGTKILYESLENLEEISVSRNYHSFSRMDESASTLFFMGIREDSLYSFTEDDVHRFESLAAAGGRLLFLFYPEKGCFCEEDDDEKEAAAEEDNEEGEETKDNLPDFISIYNRWQFNTQLTSAGERDGHKIHEALLAVENETLPETIEIHSDLSFTETGGKWRTIYARDGLPVIIEREWEKGSVVLVADTYFASNEALTNKRDDELLSWLIGPNNLVIMDETHLGVMNNPGVASLARRYHLESLLGAMLLVVLLFIWKNAVSFVPPQKEESTAGGSSKTESDRDHLAGFTGLLKRSVPSETVLSVCLKEWEKSVEKKLLTCHGGAAQIHGLLNHEKSGDQGQSDPVDLYRKISKLLLERKYKI